MEGASREAEERKRVNSVERERAPAAYLPSTSAEVIFHAPAASRAAAYSTL